MPEQRSPALGPRCGMRTRGPIGLPLSHSVIDVRVTKSIVVFNHFPLVPFRSVLQPIILHQSTIAVVSTSPGRLPITEKENEK